MNKTIVQGRVTKLQSLQSIIELSEFLKFIETNQLYSSELNRKVEHLINLWSSTMPNIYSDPPSTWDDVITNRAIYFEFIEDKYYGRDCKAHGVSSLNFTSRMDDDDEDLIEKSKTLKKIDKAKEAMVICFANAAQFQGNYTLALKKLKFTKDLSKSQSSHLSDLKISWMHCYLNTHLARSRFANNAEKKLNIFFGALCLKELVKFDTLNELHIGNDLKQDQQILHGKFCKFLIETFIACESNEYFEQLQDDDKKSKQLFDYIGISRSSTLDQVDY